MQAAVRDRGVLVADSRRVASSAPAGEDVVLAYDGTSEARAALDEAISQAWRSGGSVLIVYGFEPPGSRVGEGFKEHRRVLEERGSMLTAEAAKVVRAAGVEAETLLIRRAPAAAAAAVASERGARAVIVGTRGEGPLKGAILGSLAHKLLVLSEVPVLCVRS